jgi:hypothetical protein
MIKIKRKRQKLKRLQLEKQELNEVVAFRKLQDPEEWAEVSDPVLVPLGKQLRQADLLVIEHA